jgi:hypothetical protein
MLHSIKFSQRTDEGDNVQLLVLWNTVRVIGDGADEVEVACLDSGMRRIGGAQFIGPFVPNPKQSQFRPVLLFGFPYAEYTSTRHRFC